MKTKREIIFTLIDVLSAIVCVFFAGCKLQVDKLALEGYHAEIVLPSSAVDTLSSR